MSITTMTIDYLSGKRYVGHNEAGGQIVVDGEAITLGVHPMEALLATLGTCTAFDVVSILAKRRTPVESYHTELHKASGRRSIPGGTLGSESAIS